MPTCTATRRNGTQCTQPAIKGATVCRMHGGSAPQVRAKAAQRLLEAADPAAAYLASLVKNPKAPESDRRQAATAILDRAGLSPKQVVEHSGPGGEPIQGLIRVEFVEPKGEVQG